MAMKFSRHPYGFLGLGLLLAGTLIGSVSYLVLASTPLTALGMSAIILGAVCLALERARPTTPPEVSAILLEAGMQNIGAIVEELGLRSKAIYLPSSMTGGRPKALIPLQATLSGLTLKTPLPNRLIARYGPGADDIGLLVTTPGSAAINMLEAKPGGTSTELEAALSSVLVGTTDLAAGVRVTMGDKRVTVEISDPSMEYENIWFYECLGSPLASILASVVAEALDQAIRVAREEHGRRKEVIELEVLG